MSKNQDIQPLDVAWNTDRYIKVLDYCPNNLIGDALKKELKDSLPFDDGCGRKGIILLFERNKVLSWWKNISRNKIRACEEFKIVPIGTLELFDKIVERIKLLPNDIKLYFY